MPDITKLRQALRQYEKALDNQQELLDESFGTVKRQYSRLRPVYDGVAAREFKHGWTRTSAAFDEYTERLAAVRDLLRDRIDALDAVDRAEG